MSTLLNDTKTKTSMTPSHNNKGQLDIVEGDYSALLPPIIEDDSELLRYGVVRVPVVASLERKRSDTNNSSSLLLLLPDDDAGGKRRHAAENDECVENDDDEHDDEHEEHSPPETTTMILDLAYWAAELSRVTPQIIAMQGDGEYAFYRNIMDDPINFPFDTILRQSRVGEAMKRYFNITIPPPPLVDDDHRVVVSEENDEDKNSIRLDDAFCVHYNTSQEDSSGARHMDPSDITVNICLQASDDMEGSQVLFHGTQQLLASSISQKTKTNIDDDDDDKDNKDSSSFSFFVPQIPGTATIHWGHHPHQTTSITAGHRTNVILTYCYTDPNRSDVATRTCYG